MALTRAETYTERTEREQREAHRAAEARVNGDLAEIDGPSPEWRNEAIQEIADMDAITSSARPPLATSQAARAATPAPKVVPGNVVPDQPAPKAIKGAVKVDAFPERCKYPFPQIARDGGIWQLDPAAYGVTAAAIKQAAPKWAQSHGLTVKVVADDGMVYVQFGGGITAQRRAELEQAVRGRQ